MLIDSYSQVLPQPVTNRSSLCASSWERRSAAGEKQPRQSSHVKDMPQKAASASGGVVRETMRSRAPRARAQMRERERASTRPDRCASR
jgi:hypothetical protein